MTKKQFLPFLYIGAFLRLLLIWRAPLWYDENFTLLVSRLSWDRMLAAVTGDVHPPLWYIITWITAHIIPTPWAIRLPAALIGIAGLYVFWRILVDMQIPLKAQFVAMGLMVISPALLYYSQEGRMYSMLAVLVMVAFHSAWFGKWTRFTLAAIALYYTQVYAVFYLAALVLALLIRDRGNWKPLLKSGLMVSLAGIPWAFVTLSQMQNISGNYWIMTDSVGSLVYVIERLFFGKNFPDVLKTWDLVAAVVLFEAITIAVIFVLKHRSKNMLPVCIMAFIPPILALLASVIWQPILLHRPLIGILPFLFILLAMPAEWITADPLRSIFAAAFIIPIFGASIIGVYTGDVKQNYAEGLEYILTNWQPGDVIYHYGDGTFVNWSPYLGQLADYQYMEYPCDPTLGQLSLTTRQALGVKFSPLENIPYKRAWIVWGETPLTPDCLVRPEGDPLLVLEQNDYVFAGLWRYEH
jgi:hypothetical protein